MKNDTCDGGRGPLRGPSGYVFQVLAEKQGTIRGASGDHQKVKHDTCDGGRGLLSRGLFRIWQKMGVGGS